MRKPLQLEWFGGSTERRFRELRPGIDDLPWGTLDKARYPAPLLECARSFWTRTVFGEYRAAALFSQLVHTMLNADVPVDFVAVVSDFVMDELSHVELASRVAMEMGGGAPYEADYRSLTHLSPPGQSALHSCNEQVLRLCCIEVVNTQMLSSSLKVCKHPLISAVLRKILQDEAPHGRFGFEYLRWADAELDDAERERLAGITLSVIGDLVTSHQRLTSTAKDGVTQEGYLVEHVNELGWMEAQAYVQRARQVIVDKVVTPLMEHGIPIDPRQLPEQLRELHTS